MRCRSSSGASSTSTTSTRPPGARPASAAATRATSLRRHAGSAFVGRTATSRSLSGRARLVAREPNNATVPTPSTTATAYAIRASRPPADVSMRSAIVSDRLPPRQLPPRQPPPAVAAQTSTHRGGKTFGSLWMSSRTTRPVAAGAQDQDPPSGRDPPDSRGRTAAPGRELTGERGLPDLPGTEQGDDRRLPQEQRQREQMTPPMNLHFALNSEHVVHILQCICLRHRAR